MLGGATASAEHCDELRARGVSVVAVDALAPCGAAADVDDGGAGAARAAAAMAALTQLMPSPPAECVEAAVRMVAAAAASAVDGAEWRAAEARAMPVLVSAAETLLLDRLSEARARRALRARALSPLASARRRRRGARRARAARGEPPPRAAARPRALSVASPLADGRDGRSRRLRWRARDRDGR